MESEVPRFEASGFGAKVQLDEDPLIWLLQDFFDTDI